MRLRVCWTFKRIDITIAQPGGLIGEFRTRAELNNEQEKTTMLDDCNTNGNIVILDKFDTI